MNRRLGSRGLLLVTVVLAAAGWLASGNPAYAVMIVLIIAASMALWGGMGDYRRGVRGGAADRGRFPNGEPRRRDMLLSIGAALTVVGVFVAVSGLARGGLGGAAAGAIMAAAGVALWRWRRSRIG